MQRVYEDDGMNFAVLLEIERNVDVGDDIAQQLLDIEEIKNLKARYFRLLDAKSWPEWREIFTEDLEWVYVDPNVQNVPPDAERLPDGRARVDREQLVAFVSKSMEKVTTVHHGHIPEIAIIDENVARGHWALTNYVEYRNAAGSLVWGRGYGWYEEEYFRTESGWRIKRSAFYRRDMDLPQ